MARVFVSRQLPGPALERLKQVHDVEVWPERLPPSSEELAAEAQTADGILTLLTDRIDAELLDHAPSLKAVSNYAVGYDNVDLAAATAKGIKVGNTPDVLTDATADLTFALLLAAARKLGAAIEAARTGDWLTWEPGMHLGHDVHGATLGIIGFGRIGQAVAQRARGFSMNVIHTPTSEQGDVLARADFVSLHMPLTKQTHHLIDNRALKAMKATAILINTARGQIVDQAALKDALENHEIAGAALDVTDPEPLAPNDPLYNAPNLIITPHIGSATRTAREKMADIAVDNLLAALDGKRMPHQVN